MLVRPEAWPARGDNEEWALSHAVGKDQPARPIGLRVIFHELDTERGEHLAIEGAGRAQIPADDSQVIEHCQAFTPSRGHAATFGLGFSRCSRTQYGTSTRSRSFPTRKSTEPGALPGSTTAPACRTHTPTQPAMCRIGVEPRVPEQRDRDPRHRDRQRKGE